MKKPIPAINSSRLNQQTRFATTVATSAVSLALLTSGQLPLQAQGQAPIVGQQRAAPTQQDAWNKYFTQGYNYCDALVLAAFWGEKSAGDAKARLGHKMLAFGPAEGRLHITSARAKALKKPVEEMPCWYTDGGYTYDDAVLLGNYWGSGLESKSKMTRLLVEGRDSVIKAALKAAKKGR